MDDVYCWNVVDPIDLWVTDKLLLAKQLGYYCGPAGLVPERDGEYIVRPCVNYRMMSRGAEIMTLGPSYGDIIPNGFFWCEEFKGRHITYDYHFGVQTLAAEGFRNDLNRLDRFSKWVKVVDTYSPPKVLLNIVMKYEWINLEVIDGKVIEVHFRFNDDFNNHTSTTIIPVWKEHYDKDLHGGKNFYPSECGDRIGFLLE